MHRFQAALWVPMPVPEVFDFFSQAANLDAITPPWLHFRTLTPPPIIMRPGALIEHALRVRGIPIRWITEIEEWNPPHSFVDRQRKGPYRLWRHTHRFRPQEGGTSIEDLVDYALPFGPLGRAVHWLQVRRDIQSIFDYRTQRIREVFASPGQ